MKVKVNAKIHGDGLESAFVLTCSSCLISQAPACWRQNRGKQFSRRLGCFYFLCLWALPSCLWCPGGREQQRKCASETKLAAKVRGDRVLWDGCPSQWDAGDAGDLRCWSFEMLPLLSGMQEMLEFWDAGGLRCFPFSVGCRRCWSFGMPTPVSWKTNWNFSGVKPQRWKGVDLAQRHVASWKGWGFLDTPQEVMGWGRWYLQSSLYSWGWW